MPGRLPADLELDFFNATLALVFNAHGRPGRNAQRLAGHADRERLAALNRPRQPPQFGDKLGTWICLFGVTPAGPLARECMAGFGFHGYLHWLKDNKLNQTEATGNGSVAVILSAAGIVLVRR